MNASMNEDIPSCIFIHEWFTCVCACVCVCVCVCMCVFLRLVFCFYSLFTVHVRCMCHHSCYLHAKEANIKTLER